MKYNVALLVLGLLVLSASAIFNPNSLLFDERLFPPNVELMEDYGFGKKFLLEMKDQAPGPLYEFIHLPLKKITHLNARALRMVNLLLFYFVIGSLLLIFHKLQHQDISQSAYSSLHILAIPTVWQVAGLALTEVPAMLFVTLSFYVGAILLKSHGELSQKKIILYSMLMGLTAGLAILGRTPYLIIIPAFFFMLLFQLYSQNQKVNFTWTFFPFAVIALSMVIPIFMVWGGFVPPLQPRVDDVIKPWHGLLAMAYAGLIGLLLNTKWFVWNKKVWIILAGSFLLFLLFNLVGLGYEYTPMSTTVAKVFGPAFLHLYALIVSPLLATFGVYFMVCCYQRGKENLTNPTYLFALVMALAILASSAKISHQFSSRYVAQAAPFLVIIFTRVDPEDNWKWVRLIIGLTIGFLSLNTYANLF